MTSSKPLEQAFQSKIKINKNKHKKVEQEGTKGGSFQKRGQEKFRGYSRGRGSREGHSTQK